MANAQEVVEWLKKLGNNYRPPRNQGMYWDAVDFVEQQRDSLARKEKILRRIVRTHMHNGQCTWCDSDVHERDCFVAAAIAECSTGNGGSDA